MLQQEQIQSWKCPHENERKNASQTPAIFEKTQTVITKIFIYYKFGMVSLAQKKDEYFRKLKRQGKKSLKSWTFS